MADDIRAQAKIFYNALDGTKPIAFKGIEQILKPASEVGSLGKAYAAEALYVRDIHGKNSGDPVQELADQVDFTEGAGAYLFTGNRGTGKTTELLRLSQQLQDKGCTVFYADMSEYLNLTASVEISDFLITIFGALSEKVSDRYHSTPGDRGFFDRMSDFLSQEVKLEGLSLAVDGVELKAALLQDPTFKQQLQKGTRGHVARLVKEAQKFALEVATFVRERENDENRKIVFIVDSVERLRGVGDTKDVNEVFKSAETIFSSHADKLKFSGINVVYTVPPYLSALAGGLGAYYSGGRIYTLPSVHIYDACPPDNAEPQPSDTGVNAMLEVLTRRYPQWQTFLREEDVRRLACSSGGDLRDFFRMLQQCVIKSLHPQHLPLPESVIKSAEDAVRNDMLPLAQDDREKLRQISRYHKPELESLDKLPDFARLLQGKYVLNYRNGQDWYDIHPLLRDEVRAIGSATPTA